MCLYHKGKYMHSDKHAIHATHAAHASHHLKL